jgi:hypothetical protein
MSKKKKKYSSKNKRILYQSLNEDKEQKIIIVKKNG